MYKSIAIYPHNIDESYIRKVVNSVSLAKKYNFNEVFTSVHLPEYTFDTQIEALKIVSCEARKQDLTVTVDIGGNYINQVLNDQSYLRILNNAKIDFIRLDYGFEFEQVQTLYNKLNIKGFVINASIYNQEEVEELIKRLKTIDEYIEIRACHNYYIRKETGIDEIFALKQDDIFKTLNIPVYYCIPTLSNPRGPLHLGLCTIEKHRNMPIENILIDLYLNHDLNAFMMADEWLSEEEFRKVDSTLEHLTEPLSSEYVIKVRLDKDATEEEKSILLTNHNFRFDSPEFYLRSQTSRQMAEYAVQIAPRDPKNRNRGCITIDNTNNKRYSGEMKICLADASADVCVNVVAEIVDDKDLIILSRFREKIIYKFIEA